MTSLLTSYLLITPITLINLSHKTQNSNPTGAGRYQLLSRWWDAYRKQLGLKDFSPKSGRCGIAAVKERGALPMIDRGDIRQAIDPLSNIWKLLPGAGYGQFERHFDSLIARKIQRSPGGTVRRDWCMSRVTAIISALRLSASSSACHGLLIITVITPLPTKPSATKKCQRTEAGERGNYWRRCVSVMLLRSMQNTRRS